MGFFLQLKLLLWKNYVIRTRRKVHCVVELVWPLCLFTLLMLIRTKGLFQKVHQCHFEDKPMPSAGQLLFYQGLICAFNNTCHASADIADRSYSTIQTTDLFLMIHDAKSFSKYAVAKNQEAIKKFTQSAMALAEEIKKQKNPLLKTDLEYHHRPPPNNLSLEISAQMKRLDALHGELETNMAELAPSLEIINLWERLNINYDNITAILKDNPIIDEIFLRLHTFMCGNKTNMTLDMLSHNQLPLNSLQSYLESISKHPAELHYEYDTEISKECNAIYEKLETTPSLKFIWRIVKPYIRGKIIFSPNTTVVKRVLKRLSDKLVGPNLASLSKEAEALKYDAYIYLSSLHELTYIKELYNLQNSSHDDGFDSNTLHSSIYDSVIKAQEQIKNYYEKLQKFKKKNAFFKQENTLIEALKCYSSIEFEGYLTEEEAEERSMALSEKNDLLAMISFMNEHEHKLEPLTTYKLRMNAERMLDSHEASTFSYTNGPNQRPFQDLKLITYGFIYLQDLIEQSILVEHTGRKDTPGIILKQFPHPCYIDDWFLSSLAYMFPLFMVLSWVYSASMIVKNIVQEKEQKLKETTRVLGMGNGVHWCSWFIDSIIPMIITILILSLILVYGGVLANAEYSLVVVFLLCYAIATVSKCFLISTFFSKANLAAASGGIIFFTSYLPYPFIEKWYIYFTPAMKMIACLLSNVALGLGSNYFGMKELEGTGSKWNNVSSSPVIGDTFNLLVIMVVMLLDSVLYLLLTWYIENVFPGNYGMPKPWNFLFTKSYWFPLASTSNSFQETTSDYTLKTNDMFEEEPNGLTKGVSLKNLCKTYKSGKVALRNLSMNFYEDQITAFLGRNGAGKTTTISILTGLFPPTSGYASIYGLDVQTQMNLIRRSLGICPQYNVFFRDFTVQEHLWFFARLKGHTTGDVQVEIQQILTDLGLINKSESLAKRLSGGMKRKLSIAIAFIGGSRTVVLDEPTAGVDPYSRMSIWNLILKYKQGRTIILTTHNMTEAELLGDRIAICDSGELLCCGSSAFLKAKLGWGYMLTIDCHLQYKNPETLNAISKKVTESVLKIMPTAKEVEQFGTEIKYSLPNISGHVNMYQMLFDYLRDQKTQLDISSYGIADTSLEEIFLKLINKKEDHPQDKPFLFPQFDKAQNVIKDTFIERIKHVMCQFQALFAKRLIRSKRNKLGLCFELLLPALFVCFCMSITSEIPILKQPHAMDIDVTNCSRCTSFFNVLPQSGNWSAKYVKELSSYTGFGSKCIGNLSIKNHNSICMKPLYINGTRPKIKHNLEECSCEKGTFSCNFNSSQDLPDRLITSSGHVMLNATEEKNITEWILTTWSNYEPMRTGGFTFGLQLPMKGVSLSTTFKENGSVSELKNPNGTSITDNILIWFNNKWPISPVVYLNGVNNLILRASMPEKESHKYGIKLIMQGMNYTVKQYQSLILGKAATALLHSISLIFALSFVPASFVLYLIEERETNSKHLQFLAGVNWALYWIQVFVWDLCCYLMSSLLCILTLVAFKEEAYVSRNSIFCLMSLIFLHGWANIPLMYLSSHCFRVPSSAFVILSCLNISIGVITTATTYVLKVFNDEYFKTIENFLRNIFLLFPQFCLGDGVMKIAEVYFITKSLARYDVKIKVNLYAWENLGKNYALLITEGFIFFVLTLIFEKYRQQGFNACSEQIVSMDPPPHLDDDVESERKRILNTSVNDVLVMKCLSKVYKGSSNVAVNQLCLGVNKGECFGLLGLNGAGKSSTFKMLTGDTTITFGDATINGNSIRENINNVKKFIGYCPQYDALDAKLTPREHLTFYSHFRDIPSGEIETIVDSTLEIFDLCKYKDVCTKYLSGGNKRKLSTALAVFGNPQLIFLDEPTNGMDPKARRYLWQVIKQCVIGGKAVILTSHSMAECEALCSSLTIMVNGHFTCLGSIQHLKDKYGQGYNLVVRAPITQLQSVKDMVNEKIPRCLLKSEHYTQLKYHLDTDVTNLSEVLTNLENAKDEGLIYDYSLSQKSLVEIFLHFVSQSVPQKYVERKNSCRCLKSHVS